MIYRELSRQETIRQLVLVGSSSPLFEGALKAVLDTEAGRQLGELRDGPFRDEGAQQWQEYLPRA